MGRVASCSSKEGMRRGAWTAIEDELLVQCIKLHGEGKWSDIPKKAGLKRCGKSCRLRWMNYLRPNIKRGNMSPEEEDLIIRLHKLLGNRWSLIAGRIPGRTDNEIKNYWNTNFAKKCLPRHRPPTPEKNPVTNSVKTSNPPNPLQFSTVLPPPPPPELDFEFPPPAPTQHQLTTLDNTVDIVMDLDFGEISVSDMLNEDFLNFNRFRPSDSRNLGADCDTAEVSALFGQQEKENSPNLPAGDSLDLPQYYMGSDFSPLAFLFESEGLDWS